MGFEAVSSGMKSQEAVHFHSTPEVVAQRMGSLLATLVSKDADNVRLLDPGIGYGALSLAAATALADQGLKVDVTGVDLAPNLLRAAENRLTEAGVAHSVRQADFLRDGSFKRFDAAICNPPYGKRSQPELGEEILLEYREAISGHPNLFALFIHKIIRSLRPDGVAVIICPRSLMSGPYFRGLRRFMYEQGSVEHLLLFDQRFGLFDGVLQGVCIFSFRKGAAQGRCTVHRILGPSDEDHWTVANPYAGADQFSYRIIPGSSHENRELLGKALSFPVSVDNRFTVETGPLVWFRHKDRLIPAEGKSPQSDALPIIWSDQVDDGYIGAGRKANRLRLVGQNRFGLTQSKLGPALVTKRVTAPEERRRLVAALTPSSLWRRPVIYENHTNVIRSRSNEVDELIHLSLLLATELYDELLRALSHNTQVGAADLRLLPYVDFPVTSEEREAVLRSAEKQIPLSSLISIDDISERLLEVLRTPRLSDPDVSVGSDVVHLRLPVSEPAGSSVGGRKPVDL